VASPIPRKIYQRLSAVKPIQWLIIAGVFHLVFTLSIFLIGHFRILPNHFDRYGVGISFAVDGVAYRGLISDLAEALKHRGVGVWLGVQAPLHCRIYSLSFIFPGSLVGYNILAAEFFNLIYYLGILVIVYLLANEIFDSTTGLATAATIGLWPSFLLHSTQLIRDSASTLFMLSLMLILVMLLRRTMTWKRSLWTSLIAVAVVIIFWATRGNVWNVVVASLGFTLILFLIRLRREKKLLLPNLVLLIVVIGAVLIVPTRIESGTVSGTKSPTSVIAIPSSNRSSRSMWARLITQIRARRLGFYVYGAQASNIDGDVTFDDAGDIIKYLPRATVVGFFAPFPRMWFEAGTSGRTGRALAALETMAMYALYIPMFYCVWSERRRLGVWLLFLTGSVGLIGLGLVVINAGALYRLRYVFWMMLIVLAVRGISDLRTQLPK
jgi:4-amino-4-deoxy-L-arabinose transferase-like glycosyltransferase